MYLKHIWETAFDQVCRFLSLFRFILVCSSWEVLLDRLFLPLLASDFSSSSTTTTIEEIRIELFLYFFAPLCMYDLEEKTHEWFWKLLNRAVRVWAPEHLNCMLIFFIILQKKWNSLLHCLVVPYVHCLEEGNNKKERNFASFLPSCKLIWRIWRNFLVTNMKPRHTW
jgi:hypothetical protein